MTVFTPTRASKLNLSIYILIATLLLVSFLWLYLYTNSVILSHSLTDLTVELRDAKVANAELKNKLYSLLNPADLSQVVAELNLIRDNNPSFVQIAQN